MTFSIVAFDPASRSWGVAVASKCLAVGFAVPWGGAEVGAIATQALANLSYGPNGLDLLRRGLGATETVARLTADDPLVDQRQLAVVDRTGATANHTGTRCMDWKGHHPGENFTTQGNLLDGPQVVDAMAEAYDPEEAHFGQRLLHCLQAGEAAGGDRRGLESAAMSIWQEGAAYGGGLDIGTDLRVDDHAAPITELGRLLDLHFLYFERPDPATLLALEGALADEVTDALVAVGYPPDDHESLDRAFAAWSGVNNFEERTLPGQLDPIVWAILREQAATAFPGHAGRE
jgi:uncharacterized Ntn-hydrolase superfamily protein